MSAKLPSITTIPAIPLTFSTLDFANVFITPLYEAYFLSDTILLLRDNSVHKKSLYVSHISGNNVAVLDLPKTLSKSLKLGRGERLKKQYEEIFICPSKKLMLITGPVSVMEDVGAKQPKLSRFLSMGSEKPKMKRSFIEVLFVPQILRIYRGLFKEE